MIENKKMTIVACGVFILIGFVVNGIVNVRNQNRSTENKEVFSESEEFAVNNDITHSFIFESFIQNKNILAENEILTDNIETPARNEVKYIIKLFNGNIAVFLETDLKNPIRITGIPENTLRIYDREQLLSGIRVYGEKELNLALEDFGS